MRIFWSYFGQKILTALKDVLIGNPYKTFYKSVRSECSSCNVHRKAFRMEKNQLKL